MSVDDWLAGLHLQCYTELFKAQGYKSAQSCEKITEQHLDKLGVKLQGHRRRILAHLPSKQDHARDSLPISDDLKMAARLSIEEDDVYDVPPPRSMSITDSDFSDGELYVNVAELRRKEPEGPPALPPKQNTKRESFIEIGSGDTLKPKRESIIETGSGDTLKPVKALEPGISPESAMVPHPVIATEPVMVSEPVRPVPAPRSTKKKTTEEAEQIRRSLQDPVPEQIEVAQPTPKPRPKPRPRTKKTQSPESPDKPNNRDSETSVSDFLSCNLDDLVPIPSEIPEENEVDDGYVPPDQSKPKPQVVDFAKTDCEPVEDDNRLSGLNQDTENNNKPSFQEVQPVDSQSADDNKVQESSVEAGNRFSNESSTQSPDAAVVTPIKGYVNMDRNSQGSQKHPCPPPLPPDVEERKSSGSSEEETGADYINVTRSLKGHVAPPPDLPKEEQGANKDASGPKQNIPDNYYDVVASHQGGPISPSDFNELDLSVLEDDSTRASAISTTSDGSPELYQKIWRMKTGDPLLRSDTTETVYYDAYDQPLPVQEDLYEEMKDAGRHPQASGASGNDSILRGGSVKQAKPPRLSEEFENNVRTTSYRESFYMPPPQFAPPPLPAVIPPALPPRPNLDVSGDGVGDRASTVSFSDLAADRMGDTDQTYRKELAPTNSGGISGGASCALDDKPPAPHAPTAARSSNHYVPDPIMSPTRVAPPVPHGHGRKSEGNIYMPEPFGSSPQSPTQARPAPPPRGPIPFRDLYDPHSRTYSFDQDVGGAGGSLGASGGAAAAAAFNCESDDTLSDGGDYLDVLALRRPSGACSSIPIVTNKEEKQEDKSANETCSLIPTTQATRKGFLYKCASLKSTRKGWKKYWIIFDAKKLKYFSSQESAVSKRIIPAATMVNVEQDIRSGESHPYRFKVKTIDRVYSFATNDVDDLTLWTSILMRAILDNKEEQAALKEGGEMYLPDKEGFINIEGVKGNRYVAVKKSKLAYYNTYNDFRASSAIHEIDMKLASVKDAGKTSLRLMTPNAAVVFNFESPEDLKVWKGVMENAIAEGLADDSILYQVYENHSNRLCADCGSSDPHWASVNFVITLCKHCAGIHRMLSSPASKVRSLRMDSKVWTPSLVELMKTLGNDNSNSFWEWNSTEDDRIDSDIEMSQRKEYIIAKYENGKFCRVHPLADDQNALNEALCKSVQYGDVMETLQLVFSGADLLYKTNTYSGKPESALELSIKAEQAMQTEFLSINGAEGINGNSNIISIRRSRSESIDSLRSSLVTHKGYLWKTGSNQKAEFCKRWFVLENGALSYYENEKSTAPKDVIERREIMSIALCTDERQPFCFELGTNKYSGRVYLIAAESPDERAVWVMKIAKNFAPLPVTVHNQIQDIQRAGVVFLRDGATTDWHTTWIQLKSRSLDVFKKEDQKFEEIDLRKILSIQSLQQRELGLDAFDDSPPFVIDLPNRALYLHGDIRRETESWLATLQNAVNESGAKLTDQQLTVDNIPVIVERCISFIATFGMKQEGIYRLSGQHSKVTALLELFKSNARVVHLDIANYQVNDVANVLKRFLRTMEEPLLTNDLYSQWVETAENSSHNSKMEWYKYLLGKLPTVHFYTLKRIMMHLARVAEYESENKMGPLNLAAIFGPIMLHVDTESDQMSGGFSNTNQEISVVHDLISYHTWLFDVKDEETEYERKIQEALEKIEAAKNMNVNNTDELLLGVHVRSTDGECITVKVTKDMSGEDVLELVKGRAGLDQERNWGLYEIICDRQLERPIHYQESVLEVVLRWSTWPEEYCRKNCICVRDDYVLENVRHINDSHFSLSTELKYSEKKGFKKYRFEFNQMKLSFHGRTINPISSWNVEDLIFYVGVEQKRQPPTKYNCTFVVKHEKMVKNRDTPFFGHALSFASMEELYRWLAAMLNSQYSRVGLSPRPLNSTVMHSYPDVSLSDQMSTGNSASGRDSSISNQSSSSRQHNTSFFKRLMKRQTYNVN